MTMSTNDSGGGEQLRVLFDRLALSLRTATPAVIVAVDPTGRFVDVQPAVSLVQQVDGERKELRLPVVRGVPLQLLGSTTRGLFVAVPVSVGDDGLLIITDRALDNWQHGAGVTRPPDMPSPRHHDMTDAVFIPGLQRMSGNVPAYPTDAVQVRNRAGTCVLNVKESSISAQVPGGATFVIDGDTVTITGKLVVSQSVTAPSVVAGGKELTNHRHGDVTTGSGNTSTNL